MLDLDPRVHLHEIEPPILVEKKLHGPGIPIVDGLGHLDGHTSEFAPEPVIHGRRWSLFDELLIAPLDGTIPLAQRDGPAALVRQNLDFDMPGLEEETLDVQPGVSEG